MTVIDHEKIRQRAFQIWEAEGRPEGRDEAHWRQAEAELAAASIALKPKAAKASAAPKKLAAAAPAEKKGKAAKSPAGTVKPAVRPGKAPAKG